MSRPTSRGRLKAVAVDLVRFLNSPSTRKDNSVLPAMNTSSRFLPLLAALAGISFITPAFGTVNIDYVNVGNAGNAADASSYGAVAYNFKIAKNETTVSQYTEFLNAVAKIDTYGLYNTSMASVAIIAGINRSGSSGSYTYSVVAGSGNKPITYVSWFDAARFCNWMQNGQPTGAQNASTTEGGAYTLGGAMSGSINKNVGAKVWIPSEDEWYKAAYYDPSKGGAGIGGYWLYPTQSNTLGGNTIGAANSANYNDGDYVGLPGMVLTDIGAYGTNSDSFYGTNDQGGNVYEWNDAVIAWARGLRGGSWGYSGPGGSTVGLASTYRNTLGSPSSEGDYLGFRVASVLPSPSVITGTASEISGVSITLQGSVNPNGSTTTAQFEYGSTAAYGTTAAVTLSPNDGSTPQNVSASISGLQPRQFYHYRLTATNAGGTTPGADMTFTFAPSSVSTLSALALGSGILSPTFASATTSYTATVTNATTSITVTPTATDATATIKVNGTTVASGAASGTIALSVGANAISTVVTAQDGTTSPYTVTVTRNSFDVTYTSALDVPLISAGYIATGNIVNLTLGFAPPTGTDLMVVKNTGIAFITGRFSNLAQGQVVNLAYNGVTYKYVANYYGGTGNDLVLHWAYQDLVAWGYDAYGQLGNNGFTNSSEPALVTQSGVLAGKTVLAVAGGGYHSLALCSDGTLAAFGYNNVGQLGNNITISSSVPVLVTQGGVLASKTVVAVSAGSYHSLALCSDGTVAAWGANGSGQLGNNRFSDSSIPVLVTQGGVLAGKTVVSVAAGADYSLALCSDGTLAAWGRNGSGELGNNTAADSNVPVLVSQSGVLAGRTVVSISAGQFFGLALCSDGKLASWGNNSYNQLGNNGMPSGNVPVLVTQSGVLAGKTIISAAAGWIHSVALCSDGTLVSWGFNGYGELGNNSMTDSSVPVLVMQSGVLSGKTAASASAGTHYSLALCSDGTVATWGVQLGNTSTISSSVPVTVPQNGVLAGKTVVSVAAGGSHGLALAAVPNTSNQLSSLTLSSGTLTPVFDPATIAYTASVLYAVSSIIVTPTSASNMESVSVNGTPVTTGSASQAIPLVVGSNAITTVVTAPDGVTTKTYTATVTRLPKSTVSSLAGLALSTGTLSPAFSTGTTSYTTSVPTATNSVTVTPTVTDSTATITVNGMTVASGVTSGAISLAVGSNTITTVVTAQDGATTLAYTVTVVRADIDTVNANAISAGMNSSAYYTMPTLPNLGGATTIEAWVYLSSYANWCRVADLGNGAGSYNILLAPNGSTTGMPSFQFFNSGGIVGIVDSPTAIPLRTWTHLAGVIETGKTLRLYVNGVQVATSTASALPSAVSRSSNFIGKSNWSADSLVDGALTDVRIWNIARTAAQIQANMSVGSIAGPTTGLVAAYLMGSTGAGSLADVSGNNYTATLTGSPTYTKLGAGTLSTGGFVGGSSLNIAAGKLVLGGINTYSGDTIVNGGTLAVNGASIPNTGNLFIQSGMVEATGTETVSALYLGTTQQSSGTWGATGSGAAHFDDARFSGSGMIKVISHDATLTSLALASTSLNPVFSSATTSYTASVGNAVTSITMTPTLTSSLATVTVNGVATASGTVCTPLPLAVGGNTITVQVTAEDGTSTKTYTVTVTRAPSSVATLSGVVLSSGSLSPMFAAATLSYTASVPNTTTSMTVTPTVTDATATMKVNGATLASGTASQPIPLVAGPNAINVVVTAQNGTTLSTYEITVTRVFFEAVFTSATTVPISASGYNATGNAVNISLGYAPTVGTNLTLVNNTGLAFITGKFSNLAQGQVITLGYHNASYRFVVNYYGGTGNDLVLQWANDKSYAWGSNSYGQLGDSGGAGSSSNVPVAVTASGVLNGKTILSISTGSSHSLALCADGTVAAWGRNNYGQLGNGSNIDSSFPVAVTQGGVLAGKTVVAVSAGFYHSLALCSDGTVACWGYNLYGQLGNNTFGSAANSNVPVLVAASGVLNVKMVTSVVAGYYHNLALCSDGTVVAWGRNNSGQLGNNTINDSSVPVNILEAAQMIPKFTGFGRIRQFRGSG